MPGGGKSPASAAGAIADASKVAVPDGTRFLQPTRATMTTKGNIARLATGIERLQLSSSATLNCNTVEHRTMSRL